MAATKLVIRKPLVKYSHPGITFDPDEGMTKQSFKDDCDINKVVKRFVKSGYPGVIREDGIYSDAPAIDLFNAQVLVAKSKTMFEEIPSEIRKKFDNDPVKFLEFTEDESNYEEMVELGLAKRNPEPPPPQKVEVVNPVIDEPDKQTE